MTSILDSQYIEPTRPYSNKELEYMHTTLHKSLRLGKTLATHQTCGHFYFTKKDGRKEKEMLENNCNDTGNCSVCWKIGKTHFNNRQKAVNLVQYFSETFYNFPKKLTYENVDLESVFYKWLYEDINK